MDKDDDSESIENKFFINNLADYGYSAEFFSVMDSAVDHVDSVLIQFQKLFSGHTSHFTFQKDYISLLSEGALHVPLVVEAGGRAFSVFFIYSIEDAKKYLDAREKISGTLYNLPVFFSQVDFSTLDQKILSTRTLKPSDLKYSKDIVVIGEYAMWWADEEENNFQESDTYQLILNLFQVFRHYETAFLGYLLYHIGLTGEIGRAELPLQDKALSVIGPESKKILIVLSKEKGIRFLFPVQNTKRFYREQFLHALWVDFLAFRLSLQQQGVEKDEDKDYNPLDWFTNLSGQNYWIAGETFSKKKFGAEEVFFI
jgi:hypothetical protein